MIRLRSFKLRLHDEHARALPAEVDGRAFDGPGVDLRGDEARRAFALAKPMFDWLLKRQPSVTLRALSIDLESRRVLVSFEDAHAVQTRGPRPMVLRIDAPESSELVEASQALLDYLGERASAAIAKRR